MDEGGQLINQTWFDFLIDGYGLGFERDTWWRGLLTLCPIRQHCGTRIPNQPGLASLLGAGRRIFS